MGLPKIDLPLFELEVPSTGKRVKYRPFTVKEEKILLIAQESKDPKQIFLAIKQILTNCLQGTDVEKLAIFDLEYILLNIRAKSVNNEISFSIKDPDTEEKVDLTINIDDIQIVKFPDHNKIIKVNDDIMIEMRYPSISYLESLKDGQSESDSLNSIMKECINSISDGDQSYKLADFNEAEVEDFIESLSSIIVAQIKKFFDTIPVMKYETTYTDKTGKTKTFVAQGVETFFT
jgi:hypothetical protein